jgi:chaperonin cofactor prefoldin
MEENDYLIQKLEDIFNRIETLENRFYDIDHRCESIESGMEKMLDILRAHDDLHEEYERQAIPE